MNWDSQFAIRPNFRRSALTSDRENRPVSGVNLRIERIPGGHPAPAGPTAGGDEPPDCPRFHPSPRGWTHPWHLPREVAVGFASAAVSGPWTDRPTVIEFYLLPPCRSRAFEAFEQFLRVSGCDPFWRRRPMSRCIPPWHSPSDVICSRRRSFSRTGPRRHSPRGASLLVSNHFARGGPGSHESTAWGGGEWILELEGQPIGKGGILFHYNRPYGDVYMEVDGSHRRRGFRIPTSSRNSGRPASTSARFPRPDAMPTTWPRVEPFSAPDSSPWPPCSAERLPHRSSQREETP